MRQCASSACFWSGPILAEGIMASGHVHRTNRSNTWPHRPTGSETSETPCQGSAVHTWRAPGVPLTTLLQTLETSRVGSGRRGIDAPGSASKLVEPDEGALDDPEMATQGLAGFRRRTDARCCACQRRNPAVRRRLTRQGLGSSFPGCCLRKAAGRRGRRSRSLDRCARRRSSGRRSPIA